jgi:hypothetical protein
VVGVRYRRFGAVPWSVPVVVVARYRGVGLPTRGWVSVVPAGPCGAGCPAELPPARPLRGLRPLGGEPGFRPCAVVGAFVGAACTGVPPCPPCRPRRQIAQGGGGRPQWVGSRGCRQFAQGRRGRPQLVGSRACGCLPKAGRHPVGPTPPEGAGGGRWAGAGRLPAGGLALSDPRRVGQSSPALGRDSRGPGQSPDLSSPAGD